MQNLRYQRKKNVILQFFSKILILYQKFQIKKFQIYQKIQIEILI